jgi:hypothetical protein
MARPPFPSLSLLNPPRPILLRREVVEERELKVRAELCPQVFHPPGMPVNTRTAPNPDPKALAQVQGQMPATSPAKARPPQRQAFGGLASAADLWGASARAICLMAMLRRFRSRLFMEGRSGHKKPPPKATTAFGV